MAPDAPIWRPSPNFDERGADVPIDMLVLHYTGMPTGEAALERMTNPDAKVSAHYMVEEDGRVFQLVREEMRAWHAGVSVWRGQRNINARSIGIEIVNPGHEFGYRPFPEAQMQNVIALAGEVAARWKIAPHNIVGHSDVAPERKEDPGELFDWRRLAAAGLGLWIEAADLPENPAGEAFAEGDENEKLCPVQEALHAIGYEASVTGRFDPALAAIVRAFQRHWRQSRIDGILDLETQSLIYSVRDVIPA